MAREKILIVDDSEMNRAILSEMLEEDYEIIEAEDGYAAVSILQNRMDIALVLLDIVMPGMDGFGVLKVMQEKNWIEDVPVIMVSAENGTEQVRRAYEMGVTDFIMRPFDMYIVRRRVVNTMMLYGKQKQLINMVNEQMFEKEQSSSMMIDILSHIVEFRNGESGQHIHNVRRYTDFLLRGLRDRSDQFDFSEKEIALISIASALHDIGKIAIDEKILNKPGRLTEEEFAVMKTHAQIGAKMLDSMVVHKDNALVKAAYKICRWHHERYDGRGYPDGLKGDEIPVEAQVVALADVFDALTSPRVYKGPLDRKTAVDMIRNGQCGVFNPLLLECLDDDGLALENAREQTMTLSAQKQEVKEFIKTAMQNTGDRMSERAMRMLNYERMKYNFFSSMTEEIQFEYTVSPPMLSISEWGAKKLGLDEHISNPGSDEKLRNVVREDAWNEVIGKLRHTTPDAPEISSEVVFHCNGEDRWFQILAHAVWSEEETPKYEGAFGKAVDIHDRKQEIEELKQKAAHDSLTGLLNHLHARKQITEQIKAYPEGNYVLLIFDLDLFKSANDTYGHSFGDRVLKYVAARLEHSIRSHDISARIGGDEFLLFMECGAEYENVIDRIFRNITGPFESFTISVSIGVALSSVTGSDYDIMFHAADQALYAAKKGGRGRCCYYDESMKETLSVISEIDGQSGEETKA